MNYRKKNSKLKILKIEKKIKKILFHYIFPFIILFVLSIFIFNNDIFKIKYYDFDKIKYDYVDKEKINLDIKNFLDDKYFYIYDKNNSLFFPRKKMEELILKENLEVEKVDINWINLEKIKINITEEKKKYIYKNKKGKYYLVSASGKVFLKEENNKEIKDIIFEGDLFNNNIFLNNIEQKNIEKLLQFLSNKFEIKIVEVVRNDLYRYIFIDTNNIKYIFNSDFDFDEIKVKILSVFNSKLLKVKDGNFKSKVKYVNFSIYQKVFYCIKGDICDENF